MAPKNRNTTPSIPSSPALNTRSRDSTPKPGMPPHSPSHAPATSLSSSSPQDILLRIWTGYVDSTPPRVKLTDSFLAFLAVVGALQFIYVVLVGNYPFNAFLSGFGATVGQFVLTISLRIQTNTANRAEFKTVSAERAFADYILASLILHFFCVNFIN